MDKTTPAQPLPPTDPQTTSDLAPTPPTPQTQTSTPPPPAPNLDPSTASPDLDEAPKEEAVVTGDDTLQKELDESLKKISADPSITPISDVDAALTQSSISEPASAELSGLPSESKSQVDTSLPHPANDVLSTPPVPDNNAESLAAMPPAPSLNGATPIPPMPPTTPNLESTNLDLTPKPTDSAQKLTPEKNELTPPSLDTKPMPAPGLSPHTPSSLPLDTVPVAAAAPMIGTPPPSIENISPTNPPLMHADTPSVTGGGEPPTPPQKKGGLISGAGLKIAAGALGALVLVIGLGATWFLTSQEQDIRQQAWETFQEARAVCTDSKGTISVSFTNNEPDEARFGMNVVATDTQTGKSVDLGTVLPGETKTGVINTDQTSLADGTVEFYLTWSDGRGGDDTFTADYSSENCQTVTASCPLTPGDGDYLLNFSDRIRANLDEAGAQQKTAFALPAGTYDVTLASFDDHSAKPDQSQTQEQYYVILQDANNTTVATTNSISDLPDDQDYLSEKVNTELEVSSAVTQAVAYHTAFKNNNVNSIQPICALFTPTTEEVSYACNSDCTADSQCQSANANFVCASGKCRRSDNPTNASCNPPEEEKVSCNSDCSNDQQCRDLDSAYVCHSGKCRREDNKDSTTCSIPGRSCNSTCDNDGQCEAIGAGYGCVNNRCRLEAHPNQDNCKPPTGGPEPTPTPNPTSTPVPASTPTPTVPPEKQVDLPEAGSVGPTVAAAGLGAILVILGLSVLLVP